MVLQSGKGVDGKGGDGTGIQTHHPFDNSEAHGHTVLHVSDFWPDVLVRLLPEHKVYTVQLVGTEKHCAPLFSFLYCFLFVYSMHVCRRWH